MLRIRIHQYLGIIVKRSPVKVIVYDASNISSTSLSFQNNISFSSMWQTRVFWWCRPLSAGCSNVHTYIGLSSSYITLINFDYLICNFSTIIPIINLLQNITCFVLFLLIGQFRKWSQILIISQLRAFIVCQVRGVQPKLWKDTFPIKANAKEAFSRLPSFVTILFLLLGEMSLLRKIREEVNQVQLKIILSKLHSQELYHILYHPRQSISKTNSLFHLMMRVEWCQLRVFGRHLKLAKTQLCSPTVSPSSLGSLQNHLYVNTFVWGWPPTCFAKIYF